MFFLERPPRYLLFTAWLCCACVALAEEMPLSVLDARADVSADASPQSIAEAELDALYLSGFNALLHGELAQARQAFRSLLERSDASGHYHLVAEEYLKYIAALQLPEEEARRAKELEGRVRNLAATTASQKPETLDTPQQGPLNDGKISLLVYNTLAGLFTGIYADILFELEGRAVVVPPALMTAAGFLLTQRAYAHTPMPSGNSLFLRSVSIWGGLNGFLLSTERLNEPKDSLGVTVFGGLAPLLASSWALRNKVVHDGFVAAVNSGGMWLGASGFLLNYIAKSPLESQDATIIGADVGIAAATLLWQRFPISRANAALLDVGALMGGLAVPAVLYVSIGKEPGPRFYTSAMLVGGWAGLAASYVLQEPLLRKMPAFEKFAQGELPMPMLTAAPNAKGGVDPVLSLVGRF